MHEALRLYGSAPNLARVAPKTQVLTIAGNDYVVPKGWYASANFNCCHHDPEVWGDDTEVYRPSRWIEVVDEKEHLKKYVEFMPWSAGPRICPGMKFAQVEFTAVVSTVLRHYRLEGSAGLQDAVDDFDFNITPKIKKGKIGLVSVKFVKL